MPITVWFGISLVALSIRVNAKLQPSAPASPGLVFYLPVSVLIDGILPVSVGRLSLLWIVPFDRPSPCGSAMPGTIAKSEVNEPKGAL